MRRFNEIFKSEQALKIGIRLKEIIESSLDNIDEHIYGGAKVKLALYSQNSKNNVLCGIQEGRDETCILYVHHIKVLNHPRLKFSGKGKNAKSIKFKSLEDVRVDDVKWLLSKVIENAQ